MKRLWLITLLASLFLSTPVAWAQDITTGLVAYWPLNTDGTDASGNGHPATPNGSPAFLSGANCQVSGCLQCDGVDDKMTFTGITTGTTYTITAWIYRNAVGGTYESVVIDSTGAEGLYVESDNIDLYYSSTDHFNNTTLSEDVWQHIAVTVSGGAVTFYLNGATDGTAASAASFDAAAICNNNANNVPFAGRMDEVRLYSRSLTQADVQAAMNFTGAAAAARRRRPIILE